jgi:hypothetical protein
MTRAGQVEAPVATGLVRRVPRDYSARRPLPIALVLLAVLALACPRPAYAGPDLEGLKEAALSDKGIGVWSLLGYRSLDITFGFGDRYGGRPDFPLNHASLPQQS